MLEHPLEEIKEATPLSPTRLLPRSPTHEDKQVKQSILRCRNKQKELPKMGKNPQSKGMEESLRKQLNEIGASNLSDLEFKKKLL